MNIKKFEFGPFAVNTYIIVTSANNGILIDPGCSNAKEEKELLTYIKSNNINIHSLLNTHAHIDHIMGNAWAFKQFNVLPQLHKLDAYNFERAISFAQLYEFPYTPSPEPKQWLAQGDVVQVDDITLQVYFTPGHSSGSISFYEKKSNTLISGDVLFKNSIGRTDLPGGDFDVLMATIGKLLSTFSAETLILSGHGESTQLGIEALSNPFLV